MSNTAQQIRKLIFQVTADWLSANRKAWFHLNQLTPEEQKALTQQIEDAYPFNTRSGVDYAIWQKTLGEFLEVYLEIPQKPLEVANG